MTQVHDQAVLDWANNWLRERGLPEGAAGVTFGYYVDCYSSWTCDYDVTATIHRSDGSTELTSASWTGVLEALPEYVEALDAMQEAHGERHASD